MRLEGALAGNDYGRALVACAVGHVRLLVRVRQQWVQMCDKGHGQVESSVDSLCGRGCKHKRFGANA